MPSTTATGDAFRDAVAALLASAGFEVRREVRLGSKNADLYYEEPRRGKRWKVAVETKAYNHPLSRKELNDIKNEYDDAFMNNEVHELLIVSLEPVRAPNANQFLTINEATITHRSFAQLQMDQLDFEPVLRYFEIFHEKEGLEQYYIPPRSTDQEDVVGEITAWLDSEEYDPVAIIAGYGMGKTSLARHLTYNISKRISAGAHQLRVPVLINMGGISREQGVEGLIGTALTGSQPFVKGYAYPLFHLLNRAGRFVVILDGFDEMKHMMSASEFKATFQEINKLVDGKAKVIILGRPTAFMSENENQIVLRGIRTVGAQLLSIPNAPRFREIRLAPFTPHETRDFLTGYFKYHHSDAFAAKRVIELESSQNDDLLSRPVHAKMFAELATDPNFSIERLTRFDLYDHFVTLLIEREEAKTGRGRLLKTVDRREFSCDLAWHLWCQPAEAMGCRLDDLPPELFERYIPVSEDEESLRRALLSGSFLDEKAGGVFYFSHRSFQEFLVAEYIYSNLADTDEGLLIIQSFPVALTVEVYDFLIERNDPAFFDMLLSVLGKNGASFPTDIFGIIAYSNDLAAHAASRQGGAFSAWAACIWVAHIFLWSDKVEEAEILRAAEQIGRRAAQKPGVLMAALRTLLVIAPNSIHHEAIVAKFAIRLMFARPLQDIEGLGAEPQGSRKSRSNLLRDAMFEAVSAHLEVDSRLIISLDFRALLEALDSAGQPIAAYEEGVPNLVYREEFEGFFSHVSQEAKVKLREFYLRDASVDEFTFPVHERPEK